MRETGQCARLNRRSVPPSFMTSCSRSILIDQFGDATGTINRAESQRVIAKRPEHMGAWDYCQRGFWHVHKGTRADGMTAFDLFKQALDPNLADAHLGLARALIVQWDYGSVADFAPFVRQAQESWPRRGAAGVRSSRDIIGRNAGAWTLVRVRSTPNSARNWQPASVIFGGFLVGHYVFVPGEKIGELDAETVGKMVVEG